MDEVMLFHEYFIQRRIEDVNHELDEIQIRKFLW